VGGGVGAGGGGPAAARRLMAAGLDIVVLEARDRLGGRAHTVATRLGLPVDVGCQWLHSAERNPWVDVARKHGFEIDETLPDWGQRVVWHQGEAAHRDWLQARDRFDERCEEAAGLAGDRAESTLLEPGGRWNGLLRAISTWANGTELERVSVKDHARYDNSRRNWRVLSGYGTLISAYGEGVPVRLGCVVESIDHTGRTIRLVTGSGDIDARAVIVTVPTNLLAAGAIRFVPPLPDKIEAAAGLPLGVADKVFFEVAGGVDEFPFGRHLIGRTDRTETGNYQIRPHGWPLISSYFGGALATVLEREGPEGMAAFAVAELVGLFGSDMRRRLTPLASSAWVSDPYATGSYSCALPGHAEDRQVLAAPVDGRLFFAGEACSANFFGTAHGAFITGVAAAERIIAALGAQDHAMPARLAH
jgi:monoamine oxidase